MLARHARYGNVEFVVDTSICGNCGENIVTHKHRKGCEMDKVMTNVLLDKTSSWTDVMIKYVCEPIKEMEVEGVPV